MNLYLDLKKAVGQVPSTATSTVSERQSARSYNESFARRSSGVAGGDPTHDDPQQGGKWSHDESLDDDLEADRKKDSEIAKERGVVKSEAADILKSFAMSLSEQTAAFMPNEAELEYLTTQCYKSILEEDATGRQIHKRVLFTKDDVIKGHARIEGMERSRFNTWLHERFQKSIGKLSR